MGDIFSSRAGFVTVITDAGGAVLPGKISIDGFEPKAALISGIDYNQSTLQQFQHSLADAIYIYVFGDAMGDVKVQGVAFAQLCDGSSEGLLEVFDFYAKNRASKKATPITVQLGKETITGFLTALAVRSTAFADDPSSFMANYTLVINTLPKK